MPESGAKGEVQEAATQPLQQDNGLTTAATVSNSVNTEGSGYELDDGISFPFTLPKELSLHSVAIVDGVPELHFVAASKVETITEEEFAIVCKLVYENQRPEFYFCRIPIDNPIHGRQYKHFDPAWLRGTPIGELLFKVDWEMKCLHIGVKSDETRRIFFRWDKESNLQGLADRTDFPKDPKPTGNSIFMTCESVKVYRDETSLEFAEDPEIIITDQSNSLYSKYATKNFESIAYHHNPIFLRMKELAKMILVAEWLKEKGVRLSTKWLSRHCDPYIKRREQPSITKESQVLPRSQRARPPPSHFVPKCGPVIKVPAKDISVSTQEAQIYRRLSSNGIQHYYGYCDGAELVLFDKDGRLKLKLRCMKMVCERYTTIGDQKVGEIKMWMNLPFFYKQPTALELPMGKKNVDQLNDEVRRSLPPESSEIVAGPNGPMTVCNKESVSIASDGEFQFTATKTVKPNPPMLEMKETITMKASVTDNYNFLCETYESPNMPIAPGVVPDVESWNELYSELSVPWPHRFQVPYSGIGEPASTGGVSTSSVREVPVSRSSVRREPDGEEARSRWDGQYKQNGRKIAVQGTRGMSYGSICAANKEEFDYVSRKFRQDWTKGTCPNVDHVFVVKNDVRRSRWLAYQQSLSVKVEEHYYHGTTLACNITATQQLCQLARCGVCGISSHGLDKNYIRQNIAFQRFGSGFYLAPNSSKCHDYTEGANGYRAMLLCRVLPGRKYHLTKTDQRLQGPPHGYDSIYGQVGSDLNYPEIVLTNPDSVVVEYIILYKKNGTKHPLSR